MATKGKVNIVTFLRGLCKTAGIAPEAAHVAGSFALATYEETLRLKNKKTVPKWTPGDVDVFVLPAINGIVDTEAFSAAIFRAVSSLMNVSVCRVNKHLFRLDAHGMKIDIIMRPLAYAYPNADWSSMPEAQPATFDISVCKVWFSLAYDAPICFAPGVREDIEAGRMRVSAALRPRIETDRARDGVAGKKHRAADKSARRTLVTTCPVGMDPFTYQRTTKRIVKYANRGYEPVGDNPEDYVSSVCDEYYAVKKTA